MKDNITNSWLNSLLDVSNKAFQFKMNKTMPSKWVEENIILPSSVSSKAGKYEYDFSPYAKEIIDTLHPSDPTKYVAIMKGAQCGITQGVIIPGIIWIIVENPANMCISSGDLSIAKDTIRQRFDPVIQESGLKEYIRPNVIRAKSQRTGDTDFSKEFAGGNLYVKSSQDVSAYRFFSAKTIFFDDMDKAKKNDKKEGSLRKTVEARQTSYGNLAKTYYISTPTTVHESNIFETYLLGDQRKYHWKCPSCDDWMPMDWSIKSEKGGFAGIVWELDKKGKLKEETVGFKCPHCSHKITQKEKFDLNINGKWIPTAEPKIKHFKSYSMNSLIIPPGFVDWTDLVHQWLEACPPGKPIQQNLLKSFFQTHLGQPWEEKGKSPKSMQIMGNVRRYPVGQIPNELSQKDGNGRIVTITMAADLGGVMNDDTEDVRVDWEILAHSESGATYSIDQGSIGTFKRKGTMTMAERKDDTERKRWTYNHGLENSVWPELDKIAKQIMLDEKGNEYVNSILIIDSGHFTSLVYQYVNNFDDEGLPIECFSIKGEGKKEFIKLTAKTPRISKSPHYPNLYHLDVDSFKDELSDNMKLKLTQDGKQHPGFMNFPEPSKGKYGMKTYFKHFESEVRLEDKKDGEVVGFKWEKKTQENHFWDVRIYNLAAIHIQMDLWRRYDPKKYKNIDYNMFVNILNN